MTRLQLVALIENIPLNIKKQHAKNICIQCLVVRWCNDVPLGCCFFRTCPRSFPEK